ncbi:MAG: efflux RND transporter periplasmic adaptor subunit [Nibricoccus sp.]
MNTKPTRSLNRSRPRAIFATVGTLALIGAGIYLAIPNSAQTATPQGAPLAPKVTIAPVEERVLTEHREFIGRVDATETAEIRPRVSGHIEEVRLRAGQLVNKGDVLFLIDPRWYKAQFDLATAQAESARVRVSIAEREARRSDELLSQRAISVEDADVRTTHLAEVRAQLRAAEATLASARLDLEHTEVRAPIDGRVSRAYVTAGNLVSGAPGSATLLTSIVSVGEVYVYADVDEATVLTFNRLSREGRLPNENGHVPVELQLGDEKTFSHRGYIESADNRLDAATGSLVVRMVFPNADGEFVPGLFARVRLPVSAAEPTLLISERAVGTDQSQKFVLTVGSDSTVAYRTVKLGSIIDGKRVVRDGLKAGDRVIVNGLQRVRPGMSVTAETSVADAGAPQPTAIALK